MWGKMLCLVSVPMEQAKGTWLGLKVEVPSLGLVQAETGLV